MSVIVKFHVTSRFLLEGRELKLMINENETVGSIIKRIMEKRDEFKEALLDPKDGTLRKDLLVIVNSQEIPYPTRLNVPLKDGDVVALLQLAVGG